MSSKYNSQNGNMFLNAVIIIFIIIIVAAIVIYPVFQRTDCGSIRKPSCQSNLKELGIAIQLYVNDYDAVMPSSVVNGITKWDPNVYKIFATKRGVLPYTSNQKCVTWPMLLYVHMKNKDIIWCPSDPDRADNPNATVSYWYKAAIDAAWFGGPSGKGPKCQKEGDFNFPADQIVFYERAGWHWGDQGKGLTDGVTINCCFMDGHVQAKRIVNSTNSLGKADPVAPGEPRWFNADFTKSNPTGKVYGPSDELGWNPEKGGDSLR